MVQNLLATRYAIYVFNSLFMRNYFRRQTRIEVPNIYFIIIATSLVTQASSIWLYIVPEGMSKLMNYIKQKYGNPTVIITENGKSSRNKTQ